MCVVAVLFQYRSFPFGVCDCFQLIALPIYNFCRHLLFHTPTHTSIFCGICVYNNRRWYIIFSINLRQNPVFYVNKSSQLYCMRVQVNLYWHAINGVSFSPAFENFPTDPAAHLNFLPPQPASSIFNMALQRRVYKDANFAKPHF